MAPPDGQPDFDPRAELAAAAAEERRGDWIAFRNMLGTVAFFAVCALLWQASNVSNASSHVVFRAAIAAAEQNPEVVQTFGTPIQIDFVSYIPNHIYDHLNETYFVHGPLASGRLYVLGDRSSLGPALQRVYLRTHDGKIIDVVGSHLVRTLH